MNGNLLEAHNGSQELFASLFKVNECREKVFVAASGCGC
jgi:hypothetical protein